MNYINNVGNNNKYKSVGDINRWLYILLISLYFVLNWMLYCLMIWIILIIKKLMDIKKNIFNIFYYIIYSFELC